MRKPNNVCGENMKMYVSNCVSVIGSVVRSVLIGALLFSATAMANPAELVKEGMTGEKVAKVQILLRENGFYDGAVDGHFGPAMKEAVVEFQIDYQLSPDGIVGEDTLNSLRNSDPQVSRASRSVNRNGKEIAAFAMKFLSTPYVWGGSHPGGFDCSGYIYYIFQQHNIDLPRMADEQFDVGIPIKKNQLLEGDLVYFSTYEPGPSHVGIYIGANKFIHASSAAEKVTITPLDKPYYAERYLGARRIVR